MRSVRSAGRADQADVRVGASSTRRSRRRVGVEDDGWPPPSCASARSAALAQEAAERPRLPLGGGPGPVQYGGDARQDPAVTPAPGGAQVGRRTARRAFCARRPPATMEPARRRSTGSSPARAAGLAAERRGEGRRRGRRPRAGRKRGAIVARRSLSVGTRRIETTALPTESTHGGAPWREPDRRPPRR